MFFQRSFDLKVVQPESSEKRIDGGTRTTVPSAPKVQKLFKCSDCQGRFKDLSILYMHQLRHGGEKPYKCAECNFRTARMDSLKIHISQVHVKEGKFICGTCSLRFDTRANLQNHVKDHPESKRGGCTLCGCSFSGSNVPQHQRGPREGQYPYACKLCEFTSTEMRGLSLHYRVHDRELHDPNLCADCNNKITAKSSEMANKLRYHEEKDQNSAKFRVEYSDFGRRFACCYCDKRFTRYKTLLAHQSDHTTEKPFACQHCDFRTVWKQVLNRHTKKHQNDIRAA